mmetsp:Transcript_25938/g.82289  ORF Transcript_25938/g.82289 Transcript_25938/m.82289 type:complete len:250 (+) Transcript_25938:412-1161(+)
MGPLPAARGRRRWQEDKEEGPHRRERGGGPHSLVPCHSPRAPQGGERARRRSERPAGHHRLARPVAQGLDPRGGRIGRHPTRARSHPDRPPARRLDRSLRAARPCRRLGLRGHARQSVVHGGLGLPPHLRGARLERAEGALPARRRTACLLRLGWAGQGLVHQRPGVRRHAGCPRGQGLGHRRLRAALEGRYWRRPGGRRGGRRGRRRRPQRPWRARLGICRLGHCALARHVERVWGAGLCRGGAVSTG